MILATLVFLALGLLTLAYVVRRPALGFGSAMVWWIGGVHSYTLAVGFDIYYYLFWACMGLGIVAILEGLSLRPKASDLTQEERAMDKDAPDSLGYDDESWERHNKNMATRRRAMDRRRGASNRTRNSRRGED